MILLGFDLEEFDLPLEYGKSISFQDQLSISRKGAMLVLQILKRFSAKATFYCTANYAVNQPDVIAQIVAEGHEIASHGFYHSDFATAHLLQSRLKLQELSGRAVKGFRMPRMMPVNEQHIADAGYVYNSSINPTYIPGRYNNLDQPRTWFYKDGVLQLPASVSPRMRIPLFWLAFHNLPMSLIKYLCLRTLKKDGYLNLYFHPWEFVDLTQNPELGIPAYITRNSGEKLASRLADFIAWGQGKGYEFKSTEDLVDTLPASDVVTV